MMIHPRLTHLVEQALVKGIYMRKIPGLSKLDLRVEAVYTNNPTSRSKEGKYLTASTTIFTQTRTTS
jgi:hypothetical protein